MKMVSLVFLILMSTQSIFAQNNQDNFSECEALKRKLERAGKKQQSYINTIEEQREKIESLNTELLELASELKIEVWRCENYGERCLNTRYRVEAYNSEREYLEDLKEYNDNRIDMFNEIVAEYRPIAERFHNECTLYTLVTESLK